VESGELITVYRQIGGMMEAGVDILRITRVLRAQTENARLLKAYDDIDHRLTMGQSLVEAISKSPDVFSPFVISLVQQGEMRNDIGSAFLKAADYLQKDEAIAHDLQAHSSNGPASNAAASPSGFHASAAPASTLPAAPLSVIALDGLIDRLQTLGLRALTIGSGLLLALALVWWSFEAGMLERRWLHVTLYSVAALFIGGSGVWMQRRLRAERRREARCSFCGRSDDALRIQRAPRFAGAAICSHCAAIIARRYEDVAPDNAEENAEGAAQSRRENQSGPENVTTATTSSVPRGTRAENASREEEEYE
jgi:hypothetical protein